VLGEEGHESVEVGAGEHPDITGQRAAGGCAHGVPPEAAVSSRSGSSRAGLPGIVEIVTIYNYLNDA